MKIKNTNTVVLKSIFVLLLALSITSVRAEEALIEIVESEPEQVIVSEDTFALCTDGIDNDDNGATDLGDRNCANFLEVETPETDTTDVQIENTFALCTDGIDNDDNGATDLGDRNCANFLEVNEESNDSEDNNRSSRSGQRRSNVSSVRGEVLGATDGEVLGAFTGSCPYLTTYMRMGQTNDVEEVKKLQQFLSENLSIDLPVTGFFGEMTDKAVRNFQLKMKDNILLPWVEVGLHDSVENSTGYVYKTTQYAINKIVCPDMDFAKPVLN